MNNSGIYLLRVRNLKYVGYSRNLKRRLKEHKHVYITNIHKIDSRRPIELLKGQVKEEDLSLELLEYIPAEESQNVFISREDFWIRELAPELNSNKDLATLAEAVIYCVDNPTVSLRSVAKLFDITHKRLEHVSAGQYDTLLAFISEETLRVFRSKEYRNITLVHTDGRSFTAASYSKLHQLSGLDRHRIASLHKLEVPEFKGWSIQR